ncbi:MAG TPA: RHS repeat-associated core domain-containing protein [Rudaea sp.]|jgi:RHS repeat-associated protein
MTKYRKKIRSFALCVTTFACTALAGSNALLLSADANAAPTNRPATSASSAPQTAGYSKQKLRPRFVVPKKHGRKPHTSKSDFQAAAYVNTAENLAPAASATPVPPPSPADLAETPEVVLTPTIRDLANSLGKNPVQIYNWVRNHVVFTPTYGSIQGADATLQTRHGNAFDTASLLIALLRASNIPARYVYGTVEVPTAAAENWVGNVSIPDAAISLFDQGGIPVQGVTGGGTIAAVQIEHVWVEAFVDFSPSRGAENRVPTTWVPLDASYKQYHFAPAMGVREGVTLDTAALGAQLAQGATVDSDGITSLNSAVLAAVYNDFSQRVGNYIAAQKANATVGDVVGNQTTVSEELPLLAGALPYKTIAVGGIYSILPDPLRWKVQYGVYATEFDREQGSAITAVSQSLPQLVGKRLTLSFAGATSSDNSKIASALNTNPLPSAITGTSIQTNAQLTIDGQVISSGGSVPLGTVLVGGLGVFDPQIGDWAFTADAQVVAGETHSLVMIGQGLAPATLAASRDRLAAMDTQMGAGQYVGLSQDAFVGEILNYAGLAYATTVAGNSELMCKACGIVGYALPTIIRVNTRASATIVGGLPQNVSFPGIALDVEALGRTAVAADNNASRALAFQRSYGEHASAYTHLLLDALFTDSTHAGQTASTVRALDAANTTGRKIFLVTSDNSASIIPKLSVDPATINVLEDAIGAGRTAIVSQSAVTIGSWSGTGYLLEDPDVGSGDYEISGREEAILDVAGGWLPLAFAGNAFTVQGDAVSAAVRGVLTSEEAYYSAAVALLADYRSVAWSNFVAAPLVTSQLWLCALRNGLPSSLSDPGTSIISTISVDDFTSLPGAPQTNNPPYFTSTPVVNGAVGQPYQYLVTANDPDGDALTFKLASAPSGMTLSASGLLGWSSPITGAYPIIVRASDGKIDIDQSFTLTVGAVLPLDLNVAVTPQFVNVGDTVTITVATTGGSGTVSKTLTVDAASVLLDANGQAKLTAQAAGPHAALATASDNQTTLVRTGAFGVHVTGDTTPPSVAITAPADSTVLTAPTPVSGSVSDANLLYWQLLSSPSGLAQWKELARGTTPVNGALATFDPTQMANGQYDLNLVAYDANGLSKSDVVQIIVQGDLKLGLFTVSFNDLQLDVGGVPLTITRTYDSRKKDTKGDFGYGWMLSYQNVNLQRSRPLGETWESYQNGLLTFCLRPIGKRTVSIALADGKVHQFDVVASPQCDTGQVPEVFTMAFTPRIGTTSSLAVLDGGDLLFQGGTVYDSGTGDIYDSLKYQLTTLDNYKYVLKSSDNAKTFQVIQITDPNGEVLTLNAQGVTSSNGAALKFTRDTQNRITKVSDPANRTASYAYTSAGDLDTITSPLNQVSRNQYAMAPAALAHLLTSYTDPSGTQQLRNEYDATGKLIAQYDALGNKVDFSARDLSGHTQSVTDRNGNTTTYTFDDAGNITKIVDALNGVTEATFDAYGNQTSQTDPLRRQSSTTYDPPSGTVLKQADALGHGTSSSYNFYTNNGNHTPQLLQSTTDALNHTTTFIYTAPGMLNVIADPLNHNTQFGWGGPQFDQLVQMTDPTGKVTTYQNDSLGRKIQETDPLGNVTKYGYDAAGHLLTTTRARIVNGVTQTLTTTNTVDADGNVLSTTDPLGHVTKSTWTPQKQLATQTDPLGRVASYSYDITGRSTRTTYPDNTSESTGYDPNGNAISLTDRAGRVTKTDYDPLNRPWRITNPDTSTVKTEYDAAGQVQATTDEITRRTSYLYDDAGRKTSTTDPAGHTTGYGYDETGKLTSVTDALTHTTAYIYDAANRKTQTTWPDLSTTTYGYDNAGRKTSETDPAKRTTQYHYDADGRLDQVTDALTKLTKYGYDELGDKISQTDALNHLTQWGYDGLGRTTSHTLPDNRYETMGYDIVGRLINKTDYSGDALGYQYDQADRITRQTFADGSAIATSYTPSDQIASLTMIDNGSSKVTTYTYDRRDRLTDILYPDQSKLHYVYDAAGQKTSQTITTPDGQGQTVDYTYDDAGNLATVTANQKTFTYHYDDANRKIERDDPNGVVTKYTYDANGRLTNYVTTQGSAANAPILAKGDYALNAAGQRTALAYQAPDGQSRNLAFTYDGAGRLTKETRSLPARTTTWTLDAVGNRTAQTQDGLASTYAYDTTDRLTSISGSGATTYTWDTNGQLQSKTQGTAKTTFTFNAQHLLSGATLPDGSTIQYSYGPDGNIAERTKTSGSTTQTTGYLVDPNLAFAQVVAEYDPIGQATAIYVYGDELLLRIKPGQPSPNTYYHHDGLGSVTILTDDSDNTIQTYGYDAWGNMVESTGVDTNPYGHAGERYDADLGLNYLRARWYDNQVGRFVSADSINGAVARPITINKYIYANVDPANRLDPGGNFVDTSSTGVAANIVGAMATFAVVGVSSLPLILGPGAFVKPNANYPLEAYKAKNCAMSRSSPRNCDAKYPIIFFGEDVKGHSDLIDEAFGYGITPILNYKNPGYKRGWYRSFVRAGDICGMTGGDSGNDCDEYPYRATDQGGPDNYEAGRVLLRAVKLGHNRSAGSMLYNNLIAPCKLQPSNLDFDHSGFVVVPARGLPITVGRCADGSFHGNGS